MTILTKPSNEKKPEKTPLPLVGGAEELAVLHAGGPLPQGSLLSRPSSYSSGSSDVDAESMVFASARSSNFDCMKSLILMLIALTVMALGILSGYTLYRMYAPANSNNLHYRAFCDIPYMADNGNLSMPRFYERPGDFELSWRSLFGEDPFGDLDDDSSDRFFREEIEMELNDKQAIAKVDVPDFKDGRKGRFMHDFKENQSAIIDTTANRCFIMPMDHETTLPPKTFMDLMQKMGSGYYNIDTERVRRTMRVVTPPITDLSTISERIANECYDMNIYMLESYVSGVSKRSADLLSDQGKFAEFFGKRIVEFDIMNIKDIEEFERKQKQRK